MAAKKEVKPKTLERLRELLNKYETAKKLKASDYYNTKFVKFLNKYEKENIDMIFDMLEKDYTDTEIREAVKKTIYSKKDPVAKEVENIFILNEDNVETKDEKKEETKSEKKDNVYSIFIKTEDMADAEDDEEPVTSSVKETADTKAKTSDGKTETQKEPKTEESEVKGTIKAKSEDNNSDDDIFSVFGIDENNSEESKSTDETSNKETEGASKQSTKEKVKSFFKKIPTPKKKDTSESEKKEKSIFKKKEKPAPITLTFGKGEEEPSILNVFKHEEMFADFLNELNADIDNILDGKEAV